MFKPNPPMTIENQVALEEAIKSLNKQKLDLDTEYIARQNEFRILLDRKGAIESEINSLDIRIKEMYKSVQNVTEEVNKIKAEATNEIAQTKRNAAAQIKEVTDKTEGKIREFGALENKIAETSAEQRFSDDLFNKKMEKYQALLTSIDEANNNIKTLAATKENLDDAIMKDKKTLTKIRKDINDFSTQMVQNNTEKSSLISELEKLKKERDESLKFRAGILKREEELSKKEEFVKKKYEAIGETW